MTATTATAIPAHGRPAHRDGNVLRWLAAYTASSLGDAVYFLALGFAATKVASPAQAGMVMAAGSVPRAALMLGGGVVADRWGPRRVVIGSDMLRCLLILCAAAALVFGSPCLWLLVAVALVFGVVDALFMPAVGALPPRIADADQLVRLQGLRALATRVSNIAGPPLGGLAMGLGGATAAFTLAGSFFAVSVPLLIATRMGPLPQGTVLPQDAPSARGTGAWHELLDGLRYLRRHRLVGPLVVSGAICELGLVGPLNIGMILLSRDRGWGSSGYGWIISAFGAGATAGALLLTARGWLPRAGALQIATLFASSAALGLIGLAPSLVAALALALLTGLIGGVCGGLAYALVQTATAPAYLGRVTSVMSLTGFGLAPLTYPLFGAAVSAWGPGPVFLAGAAFAASGGIVGLTAPAVRGAQLPRTAGE
ncbi:MFS transporter [Actinacidiphila acididurans]|uniref:MFS transporter n=1 Tax=Actinacidiphila acididurans TaxID=2784346 RepID=A0ABS2TTC1_9ACTN|nr:MFS transporter [Actinacidiphila acididurans]MBM9506578.1 MFS transporter [Actinacidiphila acididurans]